jgi:hypothetical protein
MMLKSIIRILTETYGFKVEHLNFSNPHIPYDAQLVFGESVVLQLRDVFTHAMVSYSLTSPTAKQSGNITYEAIEDGDEALGTLLWSILSRYVSAMDSSP